MKRYLPYILCFVLIAGIGVGCFAFGAHAQGTTGAQQAAGGSAGSTISGIASFLGFNPFDLVNFMLAEVVNNGLMVMSWLVALSGMFLNISMNLTLNIKTFVDGTAAIYTTWTAIRDITSLFIIFFLLWAAIEMIIGIQDPKWGSLIKNIVIAGVLINFSFFLTGLGIDASNVVSLQLYNIIAPNNSLNSNGLNFQKQSSMSAQEKTPGISDIFMQSLQITDIWKPSLSAQNTADVMSAPLKIILMGVTGMIIEFTAAASFTLASMAFIVRFIILLILLAFSPIWFASFIIPQLKEYKDEWSKAYKGMLLFMPVYLLLMYMALNVLTTSSFFNTGYKGNLITNTGAPWYDQLLVLGVNAAIVIVLLNMPLLVAIKIGGVATSWFSKTGLTAGNIWKWAGGAVGTRTVGKASAGVDKWLGNTRLGNTLLARDIRGATTGALAKNKMGYTRSAEERATAMKDVGKKQGEIDRRSLFNKQLKEAQTGSGKLVIPRSGLASRPELKKSLSAMGKEEKLAIGVEGLKDPNVLRYLGKEDFKAIKESDKFTEDQKAEIMKAREDTFKKAVANGDAETVKDMAKNYDGTDLMGMKGPGNTDMVSSPTLVQALTPGQLKAMSDAGLSAETKRTIGDAIVNWSGTHDGKTHQSFGFINKNRADWTSPAAP